MNFLQKHRLTLGALLLVPCVGVVGFYLGRSSLPQYSRITFASPESKIAADARTPAPAALPVPTVPAAASNDTVWDERWKELMAKPVTRSRDEQMLAAIEDLARRDSARAIALALRETRLRVRHDLLRAALRGWAQVSPDAAADWAIAHQNTLDKVDAISAVLDGAAKDPDAAMRLVSRLSRNDSDLSSALGTSLISTLGANGDFVRAATFAATASPENQLDWMTTAYSLWADYQPETALAAARALTETNLQGAALDAIFSIWSANAPETVAALAATMPPGHHRELAFTSALRNWAANDPVAAAEWINHAGQSPELDAGVASIAVSAELVRTPAVAISWAESIMNAHIRSTTLAEIVRQWATTDPAAARRYVETTQDIQPEERTLLIAELGSR